MAAKRPNRKKKRYDTFKEHWKMEVPFPVVEVYARLSGSIQWMCPDCKYLHSQDRKFWRRGKTQCNNDLCAHKFRVGLGFFKEPQAIRAKLMPKFVRNLANRMNPTGGEEIPGRAVGTIVWECLDCRLVQSSNIPFKSSMISCTSCQARWFVQLLLWRPGGYPKILCPFDWAVYTPDMRKHVQEVDANPFDVAEIGESPRTPSESIGNYSEDSV